MATTAKYKNFEEMIKEVHTQSDRACALILTANLDNRLSELLKSFAVETNKEFDKSVFGGNGFLNSFSSKIRLCYMMGLIAENEYHDLNLIRTIRNFFAHEEHGWDFKREEISSRCISLQLVQEAIKSRPILKDSYEDPRDRFVICAASLTMLLFSRIEEVSHKKREVWPSSKIF